MKLRKTRKIMQLPDFCKKSSQDKFSDVMLYYPIKPGQKVNIDRIEELYYARDSEQVADKNGRILTIIEKTKR